jgi:ribonuclease BN (tRNA processing enzyme)
MCLIPGLADGRYLVDESLLSADAAVSMGECECGSSVALDEAAGDGVSRRSLMVRSLGGLAGGILAGALATDLDAAPALAQAPTAQVPEEDHLQMLGVNGGPILNAIHQQPATALIVDGQRYLIDCGGDTARQLAVGGLGFANLADVFVTHHHLDHVAGIPTVALLGWCVPQSRLAGKVSFWGPPPITRLVQSSQAAFQNSIDLFSGNPPFPDLQARPYTLPKKGIAKVMEDDRVVVHATRVFHGKEVKNAYAYRFDLKRTGKSVVFSGDTSGPNQALIALAQGCDVLVHEVQLNSQLDLVLNAVEPSVRPVLREHLLTTHTDVAVLPAVAKAANAKRLVMNHYSPVPFLPADAFLGPARAVAAQISYAGELLTPTDLDRIIL